MREAPTRDLKGFILGRVDELASDLALNMSRHLCIGPTHQLDATDATRLRAKMAARYYEWTGRDLAADLALEEQEGRDGR